MDDQNREYEDYEALHDELFALLDQHRMKALSQKLGEMNEFDISEFLGELWEDNPQRMAMVFRILSKEIAAAVFANLEVEEQETIINSITDTELAGIIEELYVDDAVDMMEELPANVVKRVMRTATPATRNLINQYLKYPENSAGRVFGVFQVLIDEVARGGRRRAHDTLDDVGRQLLHHVDGIVNIQLFDDAGKLRIGDGVDDRLLLLDL